MPVHNVISDITRAIANGETLPSGATGTPGAAITQTYSTAARENTAINSSAVVLTATDIAAKTPSYTLTDNDESSAAAVKSTADQLAADLGTAFNDLRTDFIELKQLVNAIIDDLQANNISG